MTNANMSTALGVALEEFGGRIVEFDPGDLSHINTFSQGFLAGWVASQVPREVTV